MNPNPTSYQGESLHLRTAILVGMILVAALARLIPHAWNFTPVEAMALFGGAYFAKKWMAFAAPLLAMLVSDMFLGFHSGMPVVYGCIALSVLLGMFALRHRVKAWRVAGAGLVGVLLFFLVTNGAVWLANGTEFCRADLMSCYAAGLPFLKYHMMGTAVWSLVLFGGFELLKRQVPALNQPALIPA